MKTASNDCCATRYPILLLHGAGFRDLKWPVYWGRIPRRLTLHGAQVYYGLQDCWADTATNGRALLERMENICRTAHCEKVNIIAHSKGGLEARLAASSLGGGHRIASITTVGTPHRGSRAADVLLRTAEPLTAPAALVVNNWIRLVGDRQPNFRQVCRDFSTWAMERFNQENPDVPGIFYQSYAGVMNSPLSDIQLSTANAFLTRMEGENDGLVSVQSAVWGERVQILRVRGLRGVSHLDEIDLRRRPLPDGFDICQVYLDIVADLKARGL